MINRIFGNTGIVAAFWVALLTFSGYLFVFSSYPHLKQLSGGIDLPEEIPGASWDFQSMFVDAIGEAGVPAYYNFQVFDFVNAFLLGLVLTSTIYLILTKLEADKIFFAACLFPVIAACFDFAENGVMLRNLGNLPRLDPGLSAIFMRMTQVKMLFGLISFFTLLTCIVALGVKTVRTRFIK